MIFIPHDGKEWRLLGSQVIHRLEIRRRVFPLWISHISTSLTVAFSVEYALKISSGIASTVRFKSS